MATKKPIALYDGTLKEIQSGDSIDPTLYSASGSGISTSQAIALSIVMGG
jgi:hypothetical protein